MQVNLGFSAAIAVSCLVSSALSQSGFPLPPQFVAGPYNRPTMVMDGFDNLQPALLIYSDTNMEEYIPGNITTLAWEQDFGLYWHETGTYMIRLYEYNKHSQATSWSSLIVNTRNGTVDMSVGLLTEPRKVALKTAPVRFARTVEKISEIVSSQFKLYNDEIMAAKQQYGIANHATGTAKAPTEQLPLVQKGSYRAGDSGIIGPTIIYSVDPEFSDEARKARIGGSVLVDLYVSADGVPHNAQILRGVGHGLDEKALEAVRQYRFKPATKDGIPVPAQVSIEVLFNIMK